MSDLVKGFTVILEGATCDEDAEQTAAAIAQLRGVLDVVPILQEPGGDFNVRRQVQSELISKLYGVLKPLR